jgi:hypothetical protein
MKTDKEMDLLLREALAPRQEPDQALQKRLLDEWDRLNREGYPAKASESLSQEEGRKVIAMKKRKVVSMVAAAAICVLTVSVTTAAAVKYLSREEIVEEMNDKSAKDAFESGEVLEVNQTQEAGDYRFRLYAVATKEQLEENGLWNEESGAETGGTYAVISVERLDGTPMPATSSDEYGELSFFMSPLIQGLTPWQYNIASMGGGYGDMVRDGKLYRIISCDDIALFADRQLYLCITQSTFYETNAFSYQEDGTIIRNEEYEGINVLFKLPIDPSRADEQKAAAYLEKLEQEWGGDSDDSEEGIQENASKDSKYNKMMEQILLAEQGKGADISDSSEISDETLLGYCTLEEDSVQTLSVKDGMANYSYGGSDTSFNVEWIFKRKDLVVETMISASEDSEEILLKAFKKEADGTIKGMTYKMTDESIAANIQ